MSLDQIPVHDELAEKGILGCCLVDQGCINRVSEWLSAEDFYLEPHRAIWTAISALHKDGADVDHLTVTSELQRAGQLERVGGASYLDALLDVLPTDAYVESYCRRVAEASRRRATELEAGRLGRMLRDAAAATEDLERQLERARRAWDRSTSDLPIASARELAGKTWPQPTGWLIDGWWGWEACGFLAGNEKSSKTTLALGFALSVASGTSWLGRWPVRQGPVVVVAEEDHERSVQRRLRLLGGALGIDHCRDDLHLVCQAGVSIADGRSRARLGAAIRRIKPALLVLDPWRRLTPRVDENDSNAVSEHLGWLRRLQKECSTAIMVLHHMRKESVQSGQQQARPSRLAHRLRGTGDFGAWYDSLIVVQRRDEIEHRAIALHRSARKLAEQSIQIRWFDDEDAMEVRLAEPTNRGPAPGEQEAFGCT